jgi:DNA-binding NtrC family response regulator
VAHILIIDDEVDLRTTMFEILTHAGHSVALAADGEQGLAKNREQSADIVICDIVMPGKEGIETLIELQRFYPSVKLIAMSGVNLAETYLTIAVQFGVKLTLRKPFSSEELLRIVDRALALA